MEGVKTRKIKWHSKTKKIAQIPKEGIEYALVSDKYEQIHQLVWCKDFMQDAIHSFLNKSRAQIYGFSYDPSIDKPVSMKKTRIMVTNWKDKTLEEKIFNRVLPLVHEVEGRLKIPKTVVEKCTNVPPIYNRSGVYLFNSNLRWSKAPPMISFFTLLIRIGMVREPSDTLESLISRIKEDKIDDYFHSDFRQVKRAEAGINQILKYGDKKIFSNDIQKNYPPIKSSEDYKKTVTIYTIHDKSGIVAFSEGLTRNVFPHWHELEGAIA